MRRAIPRLQGALFAAPAPVVAARRLPRAAVATSTFSRAYAGLSIPERIRQKLWGTEDVPGPKDPYSLQDSADRR